MLALYPDINHGGRPGLFRRKINPSVDGRAFGSSRGRKAEKRAGVLKNSFGRGHGSIGDQSCFVFSIENLPRIATLQLCLPEYLAHLQQSLRRADASRGFYLPKAIKNSRLADKTKSILDGVFKFYDWAKGAGIPAEDARFPLPLYTKTNINTLVDARELCHIWLMSQDEEVPSIVKKVVGEMMRQAKEEAPDLFENFGFNYERLSFYPSSQLFAPENETLNRLIEKFRADRNVVLLGHMSPFSVNSSMLERAVKDKDEAELANLKHVHFEFLAPMSLACFHQATRQRTWNHSIESIYDAAKDALDWPIDRGVMPPSIEKLSDLALEYETLHRDMISLYGELVNDGVPKAEAVGVLPHSLKVYDLIHVNGWNAIHSIGKRTCVEAQWEIRHIAREIAKDIKKVMPVFQEWAEPQCITYGKCPEIRDCGYYKKK